MAELKKCAIKKAIRSIEKSYDYHSYNGKYDVLVDLDELVDLIVNITTPTTTEAEIRAKALGVMGMAMKEYYPSCKGAYVDFDVFFHAVMAKVAEQLKERD